MLARADARGCGQRGRRRQRITKRLARDANASANGGGLAVGLKVQPLFGAAMPVAPALLWSQSMKRRPLAVQTHEGAQKPAVLQHPDSQSAPFAQGAEQLHESAPQLAWVRRKRAVQVPAGAQPPSPVQVVPSGHESSSW